MPVLLAEIDALGEQVRSDSGCVIQRHLLEAKTCDEKNRSDEVLTLGHVVDAKKRQTCCRRAVSHGTIEATNRTNPTSRSYIGNAQSRLIAAQVASGE